MSHSDRRTFVKSCLAAAAVPLAAGSALAREGAGKKSLRDRLWIFCCAANSDFPAIRRRSLMTPAEGAFYLGVPNIIMVQSSTTEAPYGRLQPPLAQYMVALRPMKRVLWSVVGSGGFTDPAETEEVLRMAQSEPNFAGAMLDDFFTGKKEGPRAKWSVEQLAEFRRRLLAMNKEHQIFATFYATQFDLPLADYLDLIDVVTLWNGKPEDLVNLESHMARAERAAPKAKKMLGCYVVDYRRKQGLPVELMRLQCETGLRWLRQGRIEGLIFLGNTTLDLGFESVEWTRRWIAERVKEEG